MQTNSKLSATQLKMGKMKKEARPPRRLAYTWHCTVVRNAKSHSLSAVLSSWRLLLCCMCWRSTAHTVLSPLLKNITSAYSVGPLAQYLLEVLSVVSSHIICGILRNIRKQKTTRLKPVQFLAEQKIRTQTVKCVWRKLTKTTSSLDA